MGNVKTISERSGDNIDEQAEKQIEFIEEYLGIKLFDYQKFLLKKRIQEGFEFRVRR